MRQQEQRPAVLIQRINLQWNKECRGGAGAVLRSQFQQAALLPKDFFSYHPFGIPVHNLRLKQEKDGFHIREDCRDLEEWDKNSVMILHPFELSWKEDCLQITYRYDLHKGAFPRRQKYDFSTSTYQPLKETALELECKDYGRAVCNGRFVDWDTGYWWYELDILNIRILPENFAPLDCFLTEEPNKQYRQIAQLR